MSFPDHMKLQRKLMLERKNTKFVQPSKIKMNRNDDALISRILGDRHQDQIARTVLDAHDRNHHITTVTIPTKQQPLGVASAQHVSSTKLLKSVASTFGYKKQSTGGKIHSAQINFSSGH